MVYFDMCGCVQACVHVCICVLSCGTVAFRNVLNTCREICLA